MDEPLHQLTDISTNAVIRRREQSDRWIEAAYSPGRAVLITCLLVDLLWIPIIFLPIGLFSRAVGRNLIDLVIDFLVLPFMFAQATMLAIWLGILVPMLYWLVLFVVGSMVAAAFASMHLRAEPAIVLLLFYPLPFAIASTFGLRLIPIAIRDREHDIRPVRFSLRRIFYWTFIAAIVFALLRLVPTQTIYPEMLLWFALGNFTGALCVFAVLKPGPNRFAFVFSVGGAGLSALAASMLLKLSVRESLAVLVLTMMHMLSLVGLLWFYRRAGYRAVWRRGYYPEPMRKVVREPVNPLAD